MHDGWLYKFIASKHNRVYGFSIISPAENLTCCYCRCHRCVVAIRTNRTRTHNSVALENPKNHAYANQIIIKIVFWCGFDWFYVNKYICCIWSHFPFPISHLRPFSFSLPFAWSKVSDTYYRQCEYVLTLDTASHFRSVRRGWLHLMSYNNNFDNSSFDSCHSDKTTTLN